MNKEKRRDFSRKNVFLGLGRELNMCGEYPTYSIFGGENENGI
jgi:hypothetical protein